MVEMDNQRFPSHTKLYKNFHKIELDLIKQLSNKLASGLFLNSEVQFEQYGWDIVIMNNVGYSGMGYNNIDYSKAPYKMALYIEYKSSIEEWGKKIDDYFRQIHTRINRTNPFKKEGVTQHFILMSFDPRFEEWREACKRTQFELVILPNKLLQEIGFTQ